MITSYNISISDKGEIIVKRGDGKEMAEGEADRIRDNYIQALGATWIDFGPEHTKVDPGGGDPQAVQTCPTCGHKRFLGKIEIPAPKIRSGILHGKTE